MPEVDQQTTLDITATSVIEEENIDMVDKDKALREHGVDVTISEMISEIQKEQLQHLLRCYSDVFTDVPAVTKVGFHEIKLTDDRPIRSRPYPLPHALRQEVKAEIREMVEYDVIKPSMSLYAYPLIVLVKKDGINQYQIKKRFLRS